MCLLMFYEKKSSATWPSFTKAVLMPFPLDECSGHANFSSIFSLLHNVALVQSTCSGLFFTKMGWLWLPWDSHGN